MSTADRNETDNVRWLALLLRQVALMLAAAIERRYNLRRSSGLDGDFRA